MHILGVRIDPISQNGAYERALAFLNSDTSHAIFTPNPEMLVKAQTDSYFKEVLNSSDLNLCDGMGLWLAMKFSKQKIVSSKQFERIPGTDFMFDLCLLAEEQGISVYLLGSGSEEVVKKTAECLQKQFPKLKIVGYDKGHVIEERSKRNTPSSVLPLKAGRERDEPELLALSPTLGERHREGYFPRTEELNSGLIIDEKINNETILRINAAQPTILFVAFGMGKQEKWIYENLPKLPSVKIFMGVGGAFDYISGTLPRAPLLMRKIGLEWVYRLFKQPKRFGRIFNATIKFGYLFLRYGKKNSATR